MFDKVHVLKICELLMNVCHNLCLVKLKEITCTRPGRARFPRYAQGRPVDMSYDDEPIHTMIWHAYHCYLYYYYLIFIGELSL